MNFPEQKVYGVDEKDLNSTVPMKNLFRLSFDEKIYKLFLLSFDKFSTPVFKTCVWSEFSR